MWTRLKITAVVVATAFSISLIWANTITKYSVTAWLQTPSNQNIRTASVKGYQDSMPPWQKLLCARREGTVEDPHSLPVIYRDITPIASSSNIFFVETSCDPYPTYRQWCSVESWAGQNPKSNLYFLVTAPFIADPTGVMGHILANYPNLKVVWADLEDIFSGTPLQDLFNSNVWITQTKWPAPILSDLLRAALTWHWGGFYTDTDVICIKSTEGLHNLATLEESQINNAVIHLEPHHMVAWKLMEDIKQNFKGDVWGQVGPKAITRVMTELCHEGDLKKIAQHKIRCANITIHSKEYFYPIHFKAHNRFFQDDGGNNLDQLFKDSYALHFWNKLTKNKAIRVGSNSILDSAAKKYCPITYSRASFQSNFF